MVETGHVSKRRVKGVQESTHEIGLGGLGQLLLAGQADRGICETSVSCVARYQGLRSRGYLARWSP